jgi:hypothetical protein
VRTLSSFSHRAGPRPRTPLLAAFDAYERRFEFLLRRADRAWLELPVEGYVDILKPNSIEVQRVADTVHRVVGRGVDISFSSEDVGLHVCIRSPSSATERVAGFVREIADNIQAVIGARVEVFTIRADT